MTHDFDLFTIPFDGRTFTAEVKTRRKSENRFAKSRLYVSDAPEPSTLNTGAMETPEYTRRGDDVENDKRWDRFNRLEIKIRRAFAEPVAEHFGYDKVQWSRKAGCSCGCSPGFIITGSADLIGQDVYVTIHEGDETTAAAAIAERERKYAEARAERAQKKAEEAAQKAEAAAAEARRKADALAN